MASQPPTPENPHEFPPDPPLPAPADPAPPMPDDPIVSDGRAGGIVFLYDCKRLLYAARHSGENAKRWVLTSTKEAPRRHIWIPALAG